MNKGTLKIIYGVLALLALIGFFKFVERYQVARDGSVPAGEDAMVGSSTEDQASLEAGMVLYRNTDYGFAIELPSSWQNYSVIDEEWKGYRYVESKGDVVVERGPLLKVRHPEWTETNPRQDIPVMVFSPEQWAGINKESFRIGAAPIAPSGLGKNSKYVFALPARYNYAFSLGYEEVDQIIKNSFKVLD